MPTITEEIEARKRELKEQLAQLDKADVTKLEAERAKHESAIADIDAEIAKIKQTLGIDEKPAKRRGGGGGGKKQGKLVSLDALKRYINNPENPEWVEGGALSIRKAGIDTDCVKQLVVQNPNVLKFTGSGPWPKVALKK